MRLISNSEVGSWLQCTRKYYFEYVLNLEPKQYSEPISKGIIIHSLLEGYYESKALGLDEAGCRASVMSLIMELAEKDGADMVEIGKIRDLVFAYFDRYQEPDEKYSIVSVENVYSVPLSERFSMVGRIDLVVQDMETGIIEGWDHKSSYNFWTPDQIKHQGQFTKYTFLLKENGMPVKSFMANQLRTRNVKNGDIFQRGYARPSPKRMETAVRQHINAGNQIMDYRYNGATVEDTIPSLDKYVCTNCPFLDLCESQLEGADTSYMIQEYYKPRTGYGYNEEKP